MTYSPKFKARFTVRQVLITTPAPHCALVPSTTMAQRLAFVKFIESLA